MENIARLIGVISVPIYFCAPLLLLIWHLKDDDTLAWILIMGGGVYLIPLFGLSCLAGLGTYGLIRWLVRWLTYADVAEAAALARMHRPH
jgi:hypothetical protein